MRTLILSARLQDGTWLNARIITQRPNPWLILRPLVATLLTYLIILAAMIWVAARLARPLRDLTAAAERFQGRGECAGTISRSSSNATPPATGSQPSSTTAAGSPSPCGCDDEDVLVGLDHREPALLVAPVEVLDRLGDVVAGGTR